MEEREKPLVSQKLYWARKQSGLRVSSVAGGSGGILTVGALQSWEAGNRPFPKQKERVVDYLCRLYSISKEYLVDDDEPVESPKRHVKQSEIKTGAVREIPIHASFPITPKKVHEFFPVKGTNSANKATFSRVDFEDIRKGDVLLIDDTEEAPTEGSLMLAWQGNALDIKRYDPDEELGEFEFIARITGVFKDYDSRRSQIGHKDPEKGDDQEQLFGQGTQ